MGETEPVIVNPVGDTTILAITENEDFYIYNIDVIKDSRKVDDTLFEVKLDMPRLDKIDRLVLKRQTPGQICINNLQLTLPTGRRYELLRDFDQSVYRPDKETNIVWFDQPCNRDEIGLAEYLG